MPKKGAQTGNQFERDIARKLGEAIYKDKDAIWRTHGSGGWKRAKDNKSGIHPGDLYPVKQVPFPFEFVVECKDRRGWSLDDFMNLNKKNKILSWWEKLLNDIQLAGEQYLSHYPVIIITKPYFAELAILSLNEHQYPFDNLSFHHMRFDRFIIMFFNDFCNFLEKRYKEKFTPTEEKV
jgi:hypothetical protein